MRAAAKRTISPFELLKRVNEAEDQGVVLRLDAIVRFRRRTRQNPISFQDFLQALVDAKNITTVKCYPSMALGIRQDEWHRIVVTFGDMPNLETLSFPSGYGGFNSIAADALADTIERSKSIKSLILSEGAVIVGSSLEDLRRLARAVASSQRLSTLVCDCLFRFQGQSNARQVMAIQGVSLCQNLKTLSLRDHLHQLSEQETVGMVERLTVLEHLYLYTSHWQGLGRILENNQTIETLSLTDHDVDPQAFCACMDSLQRNHKIRTLTLRLRQGFKSDHMKQAIVTLLENNQSLENVNLIDTIDGIGPTMSRTFTHSDLIRLADGMRTNGLVQVNINDLASPAVHDDGREYNWRSRQQVQVENKLNRVGRRHLRTSLGDRARWHRALVELAGDDDSFLASIRDSSFPADEDLYQTQCFYGFLSMNPSLFDR